jgi:hypothetical protein
MLHLRIWYYGNKMKSVEMGRVCGKHGRCNKLIHFSFGKNCLKEIVLESWV